MKRSVDEERTFRITFFKPSDCLIDNDLTTEILNQTNCISIANIITGMAVRRRCIVLCCQPMIEPKVAGLWLPIIIEFTVAVSFTSHAGLIARIL